MWKLEWVGVQVTGLVTNLEEVGVVPRSCGCFQGVGVKETGLVTTPGGSWGGPNTNTDLSVQSASGVWQTRSQTTELDRMAVDSSQIQSLGKPAGSGEPCSRC